jgi:hypothetical protein
MTTRLWREHREVVLSLLVFLALALPLVPVPGDGLTRVDVRFRTHEMAQPRAFTVETKRSTCQLIEKFLAFENPDTGEFTRVSCAN